jgi:hypothetical protein
MGFFDWILSINKPNDPYSSKPNPEKYKTGIPDKHSSEISRPPFSKALPNGEEVALSGRTRTAFRSFRRKRSASALNDEPDQTLCATVNDPVGDRRRIPLFFLGGTAKLYFAGCNAKRLNELGLPVVRHLDQASQLLEKSRKELIYRQGRRHTSWCNYVLRVIPKKSGGQRILMAPLESTKSIQRRICTTIIDKLPLNEAVHGFRANHDILSNASVHVGKSVVVCMDISDFFPSFTFRRVSGYLRWLGYSRGIANLIAGLTTNRITDCQFATGKGHEGLRHGPKNEMWETNGEHLQELPQVVRQESELHRHPILPQGAPTSPGIANAIVWRMDKRLTALARKFGGDYTRYADDLTFSGFEKMAKHAKLIVALVEKIVHTEGLEINTKKTRIMRKGRQQRVTGVVVNKQTNASRRDFDLLKAVLHNCMKKGPSTQNRSNHPNFKEHLRGRVAHVAHIGPERGAKLKKLFDAIDWSR